jgi:shikimate kinase
MALGGKVLWVDADVRVRYDRITKNDRGRVEDRKTFEEFLQEQENEMRPSGDSATLNMAAVKERADIFLENDGSDIEAFKQIAENTLRDLLVS